jgi:hypothetical protein
VSITGTNGAGRSTERGPDDRGDSSAPTGQSLTLTGPTRPYYGSGLVGFTLGDGSDSASGLDTSSRRSRAETGTLSGDTCSASRPTRDVHEPRHLRSAAASCYRYSFTIAGPCRQRLDAGHGRRPKVDQQAPSISVADARSS